MRRFAVLALVSLIPQAAVAQEAQECLAASGVLMTGIVVSPPHYRPGTMRGGVELSHTHVRVKSEQDGQSYDVAIDNVFAADYDDAGGAVPAPLNAIRAGDRLDLCGKPYSTGDGMDWVHTNCGKVPTAARPNGWLKIIGPDGAPSENLEANQEYCSIFD